MQYVNISFLVNRLSVSAEFSPMSDPKRANCVPCVVPLKCVCHGMPGYFFLALLWQLLMAVCRDNAHDDCWCVMVMWIFPMNRHSPILPAEFWAEFSLTSSLWNKLSIIPKWAEFRAKLFNSSNVKSKKKRRKKHVQFDDCQFSVFFYKKCPTSSNTSSRHLNQARRDQAFAVVTNPWPTNFSWRDPPSTKTNAPSACLHFFYIKKETLKWKCIKSFLTFHCFQSFHVQQVDTWRLCCKRHEKLTVEYEQRNTGR